MTHMSMASMGGPIVNGVTTLEAVKRTCDEYNKLGAIAKKAGLQMMTHNEGFENSRLNDGRLTYPVLLEYLDPDLMKMQFQMSSMRTIGDPVMYFTMYPGRFASAHLQGVDTTAGMRPGGASGVDGEADARAARGAGSGTGRASRWRRCRAARGTAPGAGRATAGPSRGGWSRRWRWRRPRGRRRHRRLGQGLSGRQDRRPQELLRRAGLGHHVRSVAFLKTLNVT